MNLKVFGWNFYMKLEVSVLHFKFWISRAIEHFKNESE